jgi:hypothetical protein
MNFRKIVPWLAAFCCLWAMAGPAFATQVESDGVYCFSQEDFAADQQLAGICIRSLPDAEVGTVMLGCRVLQAGDVLTAEQLGQMRFLPLAGEESRQTAVEYLPIYEDRVEAVTTMTLEVLGKTDQAPVAEDSAMETYRNLPNEAMLKVKDPEGKPMT